MENVKNGKSNSSPDRNSKLSPSRRNGIPSLTKEQASGLESVDTEGKTPAEAIKKALFILRVERNKVKVQILSEEQRGLFGMEGARPAKVRVTLLKKKKA